MYDKGILKSTSFGFPVICIGNLSVGGTGKSPTTNYLVDLLKSIYKISVLSRGYGRNTKGFALANENSTAEEIGDEPLMYFKRNHQSSSGNDVKVAVCESRVEGINTLKNKFPDLDVVLLDDAFQHRAVAAGLNILISDYSHLYSDDDLLPVGNLREGKSGAKRAQIVIISKCPKDLGKEDKQAIGAVLKKSENQKFFFSYMRYAPLMNVLNELRSESESEGESGSGSGSGGVQIVVGNEKENSKFLQYDALLITGIAKPKPLKEHLSKEFKEVFHMVFSDHHDFTSDDLSEARKIFDNIANHKKIIITTEKDWMRMQHAKLKIVFNDLPVYVQPISFEFSDEDKQNFNQLILNYVRENKTNR